MTFLRRKDNALRSAGMQSVKSSADESGEGGAGTPTCPGICSTEGSSLVACENCASTATSRSIALITGITEFERSRGPKIEQSDGSPIFGWTTVKAYVDDEYSFALWHDDKLLPSGKQESKCMRGDVEEHIISGECNCGFYGSPERTIEFAFRAINMMTIGTMLSMPSQIFGPPATPVINLWAQAVYWGTVGFLENKQIRANNIRIDLVLLPDVVSEKLVRGLLEQYPDIRLMSQREYDAQKEASPPQQDSSQG